MSYISKHKYNVLLKYSSFLTEGNYYTDDTERMFVHTSSTDRPVIQDFHLNKEPVHINPDTSLFNGHILWFTADGGIKIFSNSEVLTFHKNHSRYSKKLSHYHYFSQYFNIPEILCFDDDSLKVTEKYIDFNASSENYGALLLQTILDDYLDYFQEMDAPAERQTLNNLLKDSPNLDKKEDYADILNMIPPELYDVEFPFIPLHGDLWCANILFEKDTNTMYYIDWDESSRYIFFYDFFKMMWNTLDVDGMKLYLDCYLTGSYDTQFEACFKLFNLDFNPGYRRAYFCLFFLNFILVDVTMTYDIKLEEISSFKSKVLPYLY